MGGTINNKSDDEYSYIGDKADIGFIDYDNCKAACSYNPASESSIVQISVPFPFVNGRKPRSGFVGETIYDSVTIGNITDEPLDLWSVKIYDSKPKDTFTISLMEPPNANSDELYVQDFFEAFSLDDRVLRTGQALTVWLSCKPKEIGLYTAAVHFSVAEEVIERLVFVMAEDKISQSLSSSKPYNRARTKKQNVVDVHTGNSAYVVGRRPATGPKRAFKNRLGEYPIPGHIREMITNKQVPDVVFEGLTKRNYALFFKNLLVMEEIKLEEDMGAYCMESVTMKVRRNNLLSLVVPGLAEKRPSLVSGDFIFVKLASENETANAAYQGYIHRVEAEEILLMFEEKFHRAHRETNLYCVQFAYNRIGMRRLYQAVEAAESLATNFLFPSLIKTKPRQPAPLVPITGILNYEQMIAVEMILACKPDSPYVIHGPPGTGKTMTLIEAILQSYNISKRTRILVCAPSNSAADHLLDRLTTLKSTIDQTEIFRLNAFTRPFDDVNPDHVKFCHVEDFVFKCPPRWDLEQYRIIVSTYTSASLLYAEGIKRDHFSFIFLDEAGQASEPETMVPLSQLHSRDTVVVLAGDPMQLGPVVFSKDAESYGLGTSYLDRLLKSEVYSSGNWDIMTKLVTNYRTHPQILHLPSELFYNGDLLSCKVDDSRFLASVEDVLMNKEFPLLFVGIQGCDEREGSNPSWFNRIEASKVVEIVAVLTKDKGMKEEDIGVITPYRQQVLKIRTALEGIGRESVKVGSVEQFQGQEKQVIIISTVRSTVKHNEFDKVHYLGFLSNPKRFNVAITRARSLLVVIGNPHILSKDTNWNNILWYCVDNGAYKGCFLPEREELTADGDKCKPSITQWWEHAKEPNNWEAADVQCGNQENNWGEPSKDQWVNEQNNWEPADVQRGNEVNNWEPSKDQWVNEQNNWEPADVQCGNEVNNWEPSKDQWVNDQNNWEPADVKRCNEVNNWEPSKDQWVNEQNNWEPADVKRGNEVNNWEPSKDQWVNEQNNWQPADVKRGNEVNNWEPSKDQWLNEQNNWQPADVQRGKEEKNWEPSKDQWVNEQNNWEPSNGQWGDVRNSWESSHRQSGEKHNDWGSSTPEWDERKEGSCEVKEGVEEISNRISNMSYKDIQPTGWD